MEQAEEISSRSRSRSSPKPTNGKSKRLSSLKKQKKSKENGASAKKKNEKKKPKMERRSSDPELATSHKNQKRWSKKKANTNLRKSSPALMIGMNRNAVKLSGHENYKSVLVYDKPKSGQSIKKDDAYFQGVWASRIPQQINPTELWLFDEDDEPEYLEGSTTLFGYWGFRSDLSDEHDDFKPEDLWVYPPVATIPKNFEIRGVWIYPQIKTNISHFAPGEVGFLEVAKSTKTNKLDIGGIWRVYFKKDHQKKKEALAIFQIKVGIGDDKFVALFPVKKTDTVGETREKLSKKDDKLPADQSLVYKGEVLEDNEKLEKYDIGHGAILEFEGMKLFVQEWDNNVLQIPVSSDDTIQKIRDQISILNGVPSNLLRLSFENSLLSKEDGKLQRYGIYHKATLRLEPLQLRIKQSNKKDVVVLVRPIDSIRQVKERISQRAAILTKPPRRLFFNGKELKDSRRLTDYKVEHGSTLSLVMLQLFIKHWSGDVVELDVSPDATVGDVKDAFLKLHGTPIAHQNLYFNKTGPLDSAKRVSQYQIKNAATLSLLSLAPIQILLKAPDETETELIVDPTDLIEDLKEEVEQEIGIARDRQNLFFNQKVLDGNLCLAEHGIVEGSRIQVRIT
jgi:uncharacterized ubiquitin-like protein YukD